LAQTFERKLRQLDGWEIQDDSERRNRHIALRSGKTASSFVAFITLTALLDSLLHR
jgi:hypothetical protein